MEIQKKTKKTAPCFLSLLALLTLSSSWHLSSPPCSFPFLPHTADRHQQFGGLPLHFTKLQNALHWSVATVLHGSLWVSKLLFRHDHSHISGGSHTRIFIAARRNSWRRVRDAEVFLLAASSFGSVTLLRCIIKIVIVIENEIYATNGNGKNHQKRKNSKSLEICQN